MGLNRCRACATPAGARGKERKKEVKERQRVCVKPRAAKEKKEKSAEKDKDKAGRDGDDA